MIPEKFKKLLKEVIKKDTEDAIFELYYKNINSVETLGVNCGDWMDEEISDFIDNWCLENGVEVVYEAEVDEEEFTSQGFEII